MHPSEALPFESPSRFSLTEALFNRHFLPCIFFLPEVLSSSFSSADFLTEHSFGGGFLELSVAMAKCSSHLVSPWVNQVGQRIRLWVEAVKLWKAKTCSLSVEEVVSLLI